ncbi:GIY-YIG nuclease superfamily protein [candidate division SR1 bacterium Aalborg_AAW-1]|nr:GIY-YIG nuclease superfamily protein [candidate division SR1 bacterium Aalborg_AAW-1]
MRHTYILLCSDNTLYTGISTDIDRRILEHNTSHLGAKYTRSRRPVQLVRSQSFATKSLASAEEYRIKQMKRLQKLEFINTQ